MSEDTCLGDLLAMSLHLQSGRCLEVLDLAQKELAVELVSGFSFEMVNIRVVSLARIMANMLEAGRLQDYAHTFAFQLFP